MGYPFQPTAMKLMTQIQRKDTFETLQNRLNRRLVPNRYKLKLEVTQGGTGAWTGEKYDVKVIVLDHKRRFVDSKDYNVGDRVYLNATKGMLG